MKQRERKEGREGERRGEKGSEEEGKAMENHKKTQNSTSDQEPKNSRKKDNYGL